MTTKGTRDWSRVRDRILVDPVFAEEFRAKRRADQQRSLDKKRQDPEWVEHKKQLVADYRRKRTLKRTISNQPSTDPFILQIQQIKNKEAL